MNLMFLHGALYAGAYSGMAAVYEAFFRWLSLAVSIPVMLFSARPFFRTAVAGLRAGIVHIDLPVAMALSVAFAASAVNTVRGVGPLWFDSLAMLIAALLGARQVQRSAQRMALERADSLRGVAFLEFARRLDGDGPDAPVVEVPLTGLAAGDRVEVRSGELVPVDGVVLSGQSSLDNAVLTGEAFPSRCAKATSSMRARRTSARASSFEWTLPGRRPALAHCSPSCRRRCRGSRRCSRRRTCWRAASCRCCSRWRSSPG